jgi:hypothetical protein
MPGVRNRAGRSQRRFSGGLWHWLLVLALAAGVLGIVLGELLDQGFRQFWQEQPFATNVVASVFMILIGATVIQRLFDKADEKRRRAITYSLIRPLIQQLKTAGSALRQGVDGYAVKHHMTREEAFKSEDLARDERWLAALRRQITETLPAMRQHLTTSAPALVGNDSATYFLKKYAEVLGELERLCGALETGRGGKGSPDAVEGLLAIIDDAVRNADEEFNPLTAEPARWHPGRGVDAKGLMFVDSEGRHDIRIWPFVGDAPFHQQAVPRFGLEPSEVIAYLDVDKFGGTSFETLPDPNGQSVDGDVIWRKIDELARRRGIHLTRVMQGEEMGESAEALLPAWHRELQVNGKGLLYVSNDAYEINVWPMTQAGPFHPKVIKGLGLDESQVIAYFDVDSSGTVTGLWEAGDHEGPQIGRDEILRKICELNPELRRDVQATGKERPRVDRLSHPPPTQELEFGTHRAGLLFLADGAYDISVGRFHQEVRDQLGLNNSQVIAYFTVDESGEVHVLQEPENREGPQLGPHEILRKICERDSRLHPPSSWQFS